MKSSSPISRLRWLVLVVTLATVVAAPALAQSAGSELTKHPGYVDFSRIPYLDPDNLTVEINLGGSLLGILAGALEDDETEFSNLIAKLRAINVSIFELDGDDTTEIRERTLDMSKSLVDDGWEAVVRIRDDEEVIQILIRHDDESIAGLAAMFVDGGDTAGFINIVGEVDPGQVARIGRQFNIRQLEVMDQALKKDGSEKKDREDGR